MLAKLKGVGAAALGVGLFLLAMLIFAGVVYGTLWVSAAIYPWLVAINGIALAVLVFALLPLAAFQKTRVLSAIGMVIASYVFGLTLWVWALLLTFTIWGWFAVVVGLCMAFIGIVPIALVATVFNGMWDVVGQLILLIVLTVGSRFGGVYLGTKAEAQNGVVAA